MGPDAVMHTFRHDDAFAVLIAINFSTLLNLLLICELYDYFRSNSSFTCICKL